MYWWRSRKRRDQTRGCRLYLKKSAEKVRKDPTKSVVYDQYEEDREKYLNDADFNKPANFTWQQKLSLIIFGIAFIVMIWGVQQKGWYFTEISVVFLTAGYLMAIFSGLSEHKVVQAFVDGASDLLGVALTIGLARAVSIVMATVTPVTPSCTSSANRFLA